MTKKVHEQTFKELQFTLPFFARKTLNGVKCATYSDQFFFQYRYSVVHFGHLLKLKLSQIVEVSHKMVQNLRKQ